MTLCFCAPLMKNNNPKNLLRVLLITLGTLLITAGLGLLTGWFDSPLSQSIAQISARSPGPNWPGYFHIIGWVIGTLGLFLVLNHYLAAALGWLFTFLRNALAASDHWFGQKLSHHADLTSPRPLHWPPDWKPTDGWIIALFAFLALIYQRRCHPWRLEQHRPVRHHPHPDYYRA
jgi:uncharacterized membrane protein YphA (DoxX/SURF4 family)